MIGAPIIFSRASCDGVSTIVSSYEPFFATSEVVEGRTTIVVSFDLSSSLNKIVRAQQQEREQEKVRSKRRVTYESRKSNRVG
jgi:hypothetical protein